MSDHSMVWMLPKHCASGSVGYMQCPQQQNHGTCCRYQQHDLLEHLRFWLYGSGEQVKLRTGIQQGTLCPPHAVLLLLF